MEEEGTKWIGLREEVWRDTGRKLRVILGGSWERGYWEEVGRVNTGRKFGRGGDKGRSREDRNK